MREWLTIACLGALLSPVSLATPVVAAVEPGLPMPPALPVDDFTQPTWPLRSVPAYVGPNGLTARVGGGSGRIDARYQAPQGVTGIAVLGDWDGNGTVTPGVFADGTWTLWNRVVEATPRPQRILTFGGPGQIPVAGDWNADGATDIGVFADGRWLLSLATMPDGTTPQPVWADFSLGAPGDLPVTGDWDGDGVDGIGVFRAGVWYLRQVPAAGPSDRKVTLGRGGDLPVVGDWDGDGADGLGLVRGSRWLTTDALSRAPTPEPVRVPRPAGSQPVAWSMPAGPQGAGCPSARPGLSGRATRFVRPPTLLDQPLPRRATPDPAARVGWSLREAERYLLNAQYDELWAHRRSSPYGQLLGRYAKNELAVRLPAMSALTVAIAVRTGAHRTAVVGRTPDEAVRYADWLVRSLACEHESVSPGGWGREWQSDHWATLVGSAAWLLWDRLSPQTRHYVARMVVAEADDRAGQPVGYWADRAGTVLSPGNTLAEEDAWGAALLLLADSMMPSAPGRFAWRAMGAQLAVAAYATQADLASPRVINGVPLADRLDGFNALPDHMVINHDRVHPDYVTNIQHLWWTADFAGLAGRKVPEAVFHNAGATFDAFNTVSFAPGGPSPSGGTFRAPGGTVYQTGTNGIYYPEGGDWGTVRRAPFASFDAHGWAWSDPMATPWTWDPSLALNKHAWGQQDLIRSSAGDGRTYQADPVLAASQDTYPGREEYAAQQMATAWLALYVARLRPVAIDRSFIPEPKVTGRARVASRERISP